MRFKPIYLSPAKIVVKQQIHSDATPTTPSTVSSDIAVPSSSTGKSQLWSKFDKKTETLRADDTTPRTAAIVEIDKYLQEPLLLRTDNPISWWNQRKQFYPRLYQLAMARLCVMATSVPSERIFSKAGQLITDRRCRLSGVKVNQTMFLHCNM